MNMTTTKYLKGSWKDIEIDDENYAVDGVSYLISAIDPFLDEPSSYTRFPI